MRESVFPRMKETTCKKLQEIGGFALAGGCTRKRMKQLVEMIRAARDYRWVGVYKIVKDEFVILAETGNEPPTYARFPVDRKSTRLNSSHLVISYAVFCLKKK